MQHGVGMDERNLRGPVDVVAHDQATWQHRANVEIGAGYFAASIRITVYCPPIFSATKLTLSPAFT